LKDENFTNLVEEIIHREKESKQNFINQADWWDNLKTKLKKMSIENGINKKFVEPNCN